MYDADAVVDFEDVKSRGERKALLVVVDKLGSFGPDLSSPHMKSLKGEADLFELRPKRGQSPVRAVYARRGECFIVLAIAPKKSRFGATIVSARRRLEKSLS